MGIHVAMREATFRGKPALEGLRAFLLANVPEKMNSVPQNIPA